MSTDLPSTPGFETIRNNTALKQTDMYQFMSLRFETIRNNTALKHSVHCLDI